VNEPTIDLSVAGEADRWMTFWRQSEEGCPLSIFVRMNNLRVQSLANGGLVTGLRFDLAVEKVRDDGMPADVGDLQDLEEQFLKELQLLDVGALHLASVTGEGGRSAYLVHEFEIDFEPLVGILKAPDVQISASIVSDQNGLMDLISPTAVEQQLNGDVGVISNLESNGDDGTVARRTDFWFYGERAQLEALVAELSPWGYSVDRWLNDSDGVVLFTETPVDFGTFSEVTPVLVGAAEKHGVNYDGWETFVVRPGAAETHPPESESAKPKSLLSRLFGAKKN
jgi:hypothetical protein